PPQMTPSSTPATPATSMPPAPVPTMPSQPPVVSTTSWTTTQPVENTALRAAALDSKSDAANVASKTSPAPARSPSLSAEGTHIQNPALEQTDAKGTSPAVRMVNSKRINLNYEIKDVGPSGISGVELWYTQDSRNWKRYDVQAQRQPPFTVEVSDE